MNPPKHCPFCGSEAEVVKYPSYDSSLYRVECRKDQCGIHTYWRDTPEEAVEMWNRRRSR